MSVPMMMTCAGAQFHSHDQLRLCKLQPLVLRVGPSNVLQDRARDVGDVRIDDDDLWGCTASDHLGMQQHAQYLPKTATDMSGMSVRMRNYLQTAAQEAEHHLH